MSDKLIELPSCNKCGQHGHIDTRCHIKEKLTRDTELISLNFAMELSEHLELQQEMVHQAKSVVRDSIKQIYESAQTHFELNVFSEKLEKRYKMAIARLDDAQPKFIDRENDSKKFDGTQPDKKGGFNLKTRSLNVLIDNDLKKDQKAKSKIFATLTHELTHAAECWFLDYVETGIPYEEPKKVEISWINLMMPLLLLGLIVDSQGNLGDRLSAMFAHCGIDTKNYTEIENFLFRKITIWREYLIESYNIERLNETILRGEASSFISKSDITPEIPPNISYNELVSRKFEYTGLRNYAHILLFIKKEIERERERDYNYKKNSWI